MFAFVCLLCVCAFMGVRVTVSGSSCLCGGYARASVLWCVWCVWSVHVARKGDGYSIHICIRRQVINVHTYP